MKNKYKKDDDKINNKLLQTQFIKEFLYRRITKLNKLVYDSINDDESLEKYRRDIYIDPNNEFKIIFDGILMILSFYSLLVSPFYFAFNSEENINFFSFIVLMYIIIDFFI